MHASPSPVPTPQAAFIAVSRLCWLLTGLLAAVTAGLLLALHVPLEAGRLSLNVVVALVFAPVAIVYGHLRYDARLAGLCDAVALLSSYTLVAAVCTYATTVAGSSTQPISDTCRASTKVCNRRTRPRTPSTTITAPTWSRAVR